MIVRGKLTILNHQKIIVPIHPQSHQRNLRIIAPIILPPCQTEKADLPVIIPPTFGSSAVLR
jgi:hypothetical protein